MVRTFLCVAALAVVLSSAVLHADARTDAKAQVAFGIIVAQQGLWREAMYRWERAIAIDPTYAAAFNNLAVAYEQLGMLEQARKAYEKALVFDPNNEAIRQNYDQFVEIHDRAPRSRDIGSLASPAVLAGCAGNL